MAAPNFSGDDSVFEAMTWYGEHVNPMPNAYRDYVAMVINDCRVHKVKPLYPLHDPASNITELRPLEELLDPKVDIKGKTIKGVTVGAVIGALVFTAAWRAVRFTTKGESQK